MDWSPQQDEALSRVAEWIRDPGACQVFRLFGYAGVGKTTLARHLAEGVDGQVLFGSYTGKAAYVLRQKGCLGATTIHSMIYHSKDKGRNRLRELEDQLLRLRHELKAECLPDEQLQQVDHDPQVRRLMKLIDEERDSLARPMFTLNPESAVKYAKLVVIDECSMIDVDMGSDLLSFGTKVLVLGDPAQLPPVFGGGFFTEATPDLMLTEVHRQAHDSPVLHLATLVREGGRLTVGDYGSSKVVPRSLRDVTQELVLGSDQLLVGKNATRHSSNKRLRELRGRTSLYPLAGDRLVCLRNDHEKGLLNGSIWLSEMDAEETIGDKLLMTVRPEEGGESKPVEAHIHHFTGREKELFGWLRKEAQEFDFGYALTTHKSQGSQWDSVAIIDESRVFRENRARWLYTALTRAADRVNVLVDD